MKYTSLFSAVAIAAAMGTQALATVTTNNTTTIDFEGDGYPVGTMRAAQLSRWTVQNEDLSEIIYAPLSSADAVDGYTANKHVKLNTEGNELMWEPSGMSTNKAIIEMKVRLVASDTAPAISDADVHAAVYLQVSDPVDATKDGLYAYSTVNGANEWAKLDTSAFNHVLATGDMVALRVVMDYAARTATYEGALLADAENDTPTYYELGETAMANPSDAETQKHLVSISFKGTGGIDDLFVGEIVETPSTASISLKVWNGETFNEADSGDIDTANAEQSFTSHVELQANKIITVTLWDENEEEELATLAGVIDENGDVTITCNDYAFEPNTEYVVRVMFSDPVVTHTVTFNVDGTTTTTNVVHNETVAAPDPAPSKNGYRFNGWTLSGSAYDFSSPVTADITLVATWKELFTVSFDLNDHGSAIAPLEVADGETATAPAAPIAEGWTFGGWFTDDGTFANEYNFSTPVTASIELHAKWTEASSAEGVEFGTFVIVDDGTTTPEFTAFSVSGTTATATLKAKIVSNGDTATSKTFYAKYTTTLGGAVQTVEANAGTPTVGDAGTVTVTFQVPSGNSLFLVGFTNDAAQ